MPERPIPERRAPPCPVCGKPRDPALRPFCSRRCADVDLGRWLREDYALPVDDDDAEEAPDNPVPGERKG